MNLKLFSLFAMLCFSVMPALAAVPVSIGGLVDLVIFLIVLGLIVGLLLLLVRKAPFIPEEWKSWINYVIYFVVILILINFLLGYTGHPIFELR